MISVSDYAQSRQVSKPTVYRQLKRYSKELEGHITTDNKVQYLDDEAVNFLDQHRMSRNIVQENADGQARQEIERLKAELDILKKEKLKDQKKIISLLEENRQLIQYQTENKFLLEQKNRDQEQLQEVRQELQETQTKLQETEQEVNSYVKSFFGFYRKH